MITRPLIIPVKLLLAVFAGLPKDVQVASWGVGPRYDSYPIPQAESIVIHLESAEFKPEDEGKPLV